MSGLVSVQVLGAMAGAEGVLLMVLGVLLARQTKAERHETVSIDLDAAVESLSKRLAERLADDVAARLDELEIGRVAQMPVLRVNARPSGFFTSKQAREAMRDAPRDIQRALEREVDQRKRPEPGQ